MEEMTLGYLAFIRSQGLTHNKKQGEAFRADQAKDRREAQG